MDNVNTNLEVHVACGRINKNIVHKSFGEVALLPSKTIIFTTKFS